MVIAITSKVTGQVIAIIDSNDSKTMVDECYELNIYNSEEEVALDVVNGKLYISDDTRK